MRTGILTALPEKKLDTVSFPFLAANFPPYNDLYGATFDMVDSGWKGRVTKPSNNLPIAWTAHQLYQRAQVAGNTDAGSEVSWRTNHFLIDTNRINPKKLLKRPRMIICDFSMTDELFLGFLGGLTEPISSFLDPIFTSDIIDALTEEEVSVYISTPLDGSFLYVEPNLGAWTNVTMFGPSLPPAYYGPDVGQNLFTFDGSHYFPCYPIRTNPSHWIGGEILYLNTKALRNDIAGITSVGPGIYLFVTSMTYFDYDSLISYQSDQLTNDFSRYSRFGMHSVYALDTPADIQLFFINPSDPFTNDWLFWDSAVRDAFADKLSTAYDALDPDMNVTYEIMSKGVYTPTAFNTATIDYTSVNAIAASFRNKITSFFRL